MTFASREDVKSIRTIPAALISASQLHAELFARLRLIGFRESALRFGKLAASVFGLLSFLRVGR
jgi:hypothetical protein